jgi:hypothetical protein
MVTGIILRPLSALSLDSCSDKRERNITTGLFGIYSLVNDRQNEVGWNSVAEI